VLDRAFHRTFLEFGDYRYLKLAVVLSAASFIPYLRESSALAHFGGTTTGYILGVLGAVLILWLMWFGVRKRQYRSRFGTVQGWLSAHVYLGASLLAVVTLHTGFQMGWNVHTLAYVLMLLVVLSGFYGVYAYLRFPTRLTEALGDETLDGLFLKIPTLDTEARRLALNLPDEVNRVVLAASRTTVIGGGVLTQLRGKVPSCPTTAAVNLVGKMGASLEGADARRNHELFAVLIRKQSLLERARQAVMYKARLDLWLYAHVPLSLALLAALTAHVFSVFFYPA
jgi:hypothetical protein